MSRRLALPVAAALATLAAAGPAAAASAPPQIAAPSPAQGLTLEHEGFEIGPVPPAFVLIGANDYGLVAKPR